LGNSDMSVHVPDRLDHEVDKFSEDVRRTGDHKDRDQNDQGTYGEASHESLGVTDGVRTADPVRDDHRNPSWDGGDAMGGMQPSDRREDRGTKSQDHDLEVSPQRHRLPDTRSSITHKFTIGATEAYLTVGHYPDGRPGELFISIAKAGSTVNGLVGDWAKMVSVALQYGVPVQVIASKFTGAKFEPAGLTRNPAIPIATSVTDYVARWLGMRYNGNGSSSVSDAGRRTMRVDDRDCAGDIVPPVGNEMIVSASSISEKTTMEILEALRDPMAMMPTEGLNMSHEDNKKLRKAFDDDEKIGYRDGQTCPECGNMMLRTGSCYTCPNCGATPGCG
jgi:hypothetical protein